MATSPTRSRLSIVVPVGQDTAAFENALVSVLEHQPRGCDVIVSHDGRYDDPFDLGDEVQFVTAESSSPLDLITSGVQRSRGRFVHVLANGLTATADWVDAALEKFEHEDVAAVTPVVRNRRSGKIIAAGWHDREVRLCQPSCSSATKVNRKEAAKIDGCFLEASFWRRETLTELLDSYVGTTKTFEKMAVLEASYCSGLLTKGANWRSTTAEACDILADEHVASSIASLWDDSSFQRGKRLGAIRQRITGKEASLSGTARSVVANLTRPRRMIESLGQLSSRSAAAEMQRRIDTDRVTSREDTKRITPVFNECIASFRRAA
ncbi:hypothetical protein Q31b_40840 [Novipirellula aureliae]|uniref:Glycosyl transferase family 2 n=1 Tax=Novipirellula aureliae TaxID=2527966 RepID=A0A5C6DS54_9BACT|nr:glycosyltransferase family 2 protein [Novipirellula aureliae]TWU39004.1 hypothetical protein Q31b_40840 [Novipirellula aureliae]